MSAPSTFNEDLKKEDNQKAVVIEGDDSGDEFEHEGASANENGHAGPSSVANDDITQQKKKKKKKKGKVSKLLNSIKSGQSEIPQSLVDQVLEKVRAEHGRDAPAADEQHVRLALEQLKVMDVVKGKAGFSGRGQKDVGTHKVRQRALRESDI